MKAGTLILFAAAQAVRAFVPSASIHHTLKSGIHPQPLRSTLPSPSSTVILPSSASDIAEEGNPAISRSKSETILSEFHESGFTFRIVVIGNGAILETTSKLGPTSSTSISPKTGEKLLTFASEDASFEFHVKVDQVCMVTFVTTERLVSGGGTKVMRVSRFLNEKGTPMCSLILADSSSEAIGWFEGMVEKYGQEAIM
eukprot:CCRYP_002226-RA/>CCRYP_002226-RA protein AED:0.47 eAED:0.47 QI:0/-1/0/1/-1/1/1/0/198